MLTQQEARNRAKELKRNRGITYIEIADAIGMKRKSFYNFMNSNTKLGYAKHYKLIKYIERRENECGMTNLTLTKNG